MQKARSLLKLIFPRTNAVLFILLFISALSMGPRMLNIDGDLPRHLLMGKYVLETGAPPMQEIFSYVYEHRPYTPQEWLAGVIYYFAYVVFGLNGVVLLASILIASTFTVLYSDVASQNAAKTTTFFLMVLGALVTSIHWVTRPHLFTMLFLAIWLILIDRLYQGKPARLWVFPVLMLPWANIHGEFIAGFLVLAAYLTGCAWQYMFRRTRTSLEIGKRLGSVTILSLFASVVSPAGFRTWDIVLGYVSNRYLVSRIVETRPPDFTQWEYLPLLIMLAIAVFLTATKRDRFSPAQFFLLAGFGIMSLLAARNAHLSGVVFPFVLSSAMIGMVNSTRMRVIEAAVERIDQQIYGSIQPIILTILVSVTVIAGPLAGVNRFEPSVFPVNAVRWLEANPQTGRMFNAFDWGGYILLYLWPEQKTFIESHTDVTGEATKQYETVVTLQDGWQEIFRRYNITWAIIPPSWGLARELIERGWQPVYQDQVSVILVYR